MKVEIVSESNDKMTNSVIEYLISFGTEFHRKNHESFHGVSFLVDDIATNKSKVWHRRAKLNLIPPKLRTSNFISYLKREEDGVNKAYEKIRKEIEDSNYVGGYNEEEQHDKIYDLFLAKKFGLRIPETLITSFKVDVKKFKEKHHKIITKAIKYPFFYKDSNEYFTSRGTFLVESKDIDLLNDTFFASIFQAYIEKKFEVRIFFYKTFYFSMAIFSQNDEKTKVDFRNYNLEKQNRCVPFKIPNPELKKIKRLMKSKNLSSGSIDLIVNFKNEFVFLEVNPQGQFHWLSENCNYYIEKIIAKELS